MTPEQKVVHKIIEKALFALQDLPESLYNQAGRADMWYALQNQQRARDNSVTSDTKES